MKKRLIITIVAAMMVLVSACGKDTVDKEAVNTVQTAESATTDGKDVNAAADDTDAADVPDFADETGIQIVDSKDSLNLEEYVYTFEDRSAEKEGEAVFYLADFDDNYEKFYLTEAVDIYAYNGVCIGYIKPKTEISTIGQNAEWGYISIDKNTRFIKMSDVREASFTGTKKEYLASLEPKTETPSTQTASNTTPSAPVVTQPETSAPVQEAVPETSAPVESSKYTPEEAIAVYRSMVEAGGMSWDPSLKNGGSWGTGWIYLDKGQPEWSASADLESFAMGDTVGHPSTKYYLEVTGSDESAVYITEWSN